MDKKYRLAIVGATGLVGKTALSILEEKNLPNFEYTLFCSKKSAGTKINFLGKEYIAQELTDHSFNEGFDFAIFFFVFSGLCSNRAPPVYIGPLYAPRKRIYFLQGRAQSPPPAVSVFSDTVSYSPRGLRSFHRT